MNEALLEFFGGNEYLALGTLGSLAVALVALMAALTLVVSGGDGVAKETDMDGELKPEINGDAYERAADDLRGALRALDQVKSMVPPFFVERFRACVRGAMDELGMVKKS
jgi:hypothetical protein